MKVWLLKFKCGICGHTPEEEIRLYMTEKGARRTMSNFQKRDREWPHHTYIDFELYYLDGTLTRIA